MWVTVISLRVRVPVLSEQITEVAPSAYQVHRRPRMVSVMGQSTIHKSADSCKETNNKVPYLDGGQTADDGVAARHTEHANRQGDGHHDRQTLRDRRHRERHANGEHFQQRGACWCWRGGRGGSVD